ncbi:MAG TPA: mucoidy inhibitor MuiA family protein [Chloroflexi bacterium]|nr:mucoidy inhibitor MuiA family protein [Chloroflexota bacterium]
MKNETNVSRISSDVTAVTVYPDRARVTRTATVSLDPGLSRLEISELPQGLTPNSLRASGRAAAPTHLLGVDVRRDFYVETPAERVRELQRQIETLKDESQGLEAQTALIGREQEALDALASQAKIYARGLAFAKTSAAEQIAWLDALRERAERHNAESLALNVRQRELKRQLEKYQQELDQLRGAAKRERYTASIEVEAEQACDMTIEVTYVVRGAGWSPLYDTRLLETEKSPVLEIGYLAEVTQQTGEEWIDVELTLSTARPALAETLPELDPWYVAPAPVRSVDMMQMGRVAAAPAMEMWDAGAEAAPEAMIEAEDVVAMVAHTGAAVTYRTPGVATIPANGTSQKVTVARLQLTPEITYVAAPKLVEAVYRRATVVNDSAYVFLPGPVNLFVDETFIGATEIDLVAPDGEMALYLGPDDRVRVTRELRRREVDKKLIGGQRRLLYGYDALLENLLPVGIETTLYDQIPVARHEDIKVKLTSAEPELAEQSDLGILTWRLTLAPGEKRSVRFDFLVEHPKDMKVKGLL